MPGGEKYDVFLSLAGPDRPAVRALYDALTKERLRVFLDETSLDC